MTELLPPQQAGALTVDQALQQAIAHHQAGQLQDAERLYRAILQVQPNHPDANHNLGVLAAQLEQYAAGLPYLKTALALDPAREQYVLSYAQALLATGQAKEALNVLESAIERGLGTAAVQALRQEAEAAARGRSVNGKAPTPAEIDQLVGLFNAARYAELEARARLLLEQYPDSGLAWKVLGASLGAQGKDALPALQKAIELLPDDAEAHSNLGNALQALGQIDAAVASYRRALEVKPDYALVHYNFGNAQKALGQIDAAVASYRRALEIKPDYAEAHYNLGNALKNLGHLDDAVASYRRALAIRPDYAEAHCNLGGALKDLGQVDDEAASYRRALKIKPDFAAVHSNLLFSLSHDATVDAASLFAEHCRFGAQFEAPLRAHWPRHANARDPERPLRIGFVSADFCNHAVAYFIEPVLAHLSRQPLLSLHAYYNYAVEDAVTERLRGYLAHWHPVVGLSDEVLAQRIRADSIDILIDLSGHTARNRLLTFARKPAPVQASWMGYPGTTGLGAMDYYLADRFFLPLVPFASQFTEQIVHLPTGAPFMPSQAAPAVNALPALDTGQVTFGSFNNPRKLGRPVIALWGQLLRALPDSRMLLGGMPEQGKYDTLIEWFAQEGIARDRLNFFARCGMDAYLGLHHQVDICLDTFPYNGGTTTYHALWMGVPTLTLAGSTAAGRSGAAILGQVGLEAFVADDAADFVQKGVSWAGNLGALSAIRAGLRERVANSGMGRPAAVAEALQRALRIMWRRWCAGLPAESFEVSLQDVDSQAGEAPNLRQSAMQREVEAPAAQAARRQTGAAVPNGAAPPAAEASQLIALFNAARYVELEARARLLLEQYPDSGLAWKGLGISLQVQGKDALPALKKATALMPDDAETHNSLGNALRDLGRLDAAVTSFRRALAIKPDFAAAHSNLGNALRDLGQLDAAVASYRRALEIEPDYAGAHNNLGAALRDLGQLDAAVASCSRALEIRPDYVEAHNNLGNALGDLGQLDAAVASYRRALVLTVGYAEVHNNLGNAQKALGQIDAAVASYRRALEIKPDYAEAHNNLGNALRDLGQLDAAVASFRRALEIKPDYAEAHNNLGNSLKDLGQIDAAVGSYHRVLKIKPDFAGAHSNLLFCLSHDATVDAAKLFAEHCRFGEQFEAPLRAHWPRHANARDPERSLRIGFVSADFRNHAVATFIEPVLAHLSRQPQFSLHAYYNYAVEDAVTERLRGYLAHWHPVVGLSDEVLAQRIRADGIDILIDLSGHTARNRLLTFARKPAPVQAGWMGYPGTTGLGAMDYYLADRFFLPLVPFASQFTEQIVHLPASAPFMPSQAAPAVNALPALGTGQVTFGSFNRSDKLGRPVIALWGQLLRALPDSRMLLGGMPEQGKYDTLIEWFAQEGIARERLSFFARCGMDVYLGLHHQVDICLDTFPYNGGTTTYHALWMGVPTLTLAGSTAAGRSGAAILGQVGLEAFVAHDAADFVQKGVSWAGNLGALSAIRAGLRERVTNSGMGRPAAVAEGLQRALRTMWRRWCAGLPAESFEVSLQDVDSQAGEAPNLRQSARQREVEAPAAQAARQQAGAAVPNGAAPPAVEASQLIALFNAARYVELEARARLLLEQYPDSGLAWNALGISLQAQGKDALPALQQATALMPDDAEAHSNLGIALRDRGQIDAAMASYRRALAIKPDSAAAHSNLGNALRDLGQLDAAVASYRRALEIKPDYAEVHNNLGAALRDLGQLNDAVASYRRALEIKPDHAEAHNNLGAILRDLGHIDDAVASCRRALEIRPDYAAAHNNLGNALGDLGQLDAAVASYRRALEIKPDLAEVHSNLGVAQGDLKRLDDAVASYRRALEIKPDYAEAQNNLGIALKDLGQIDAAVRSYRRALEIKPDYAEAHNNLGNALKDLGQLEDAVACYHRALKIKPDFAGAHSNLLFCLSHDATMDAASLFSEHCRFGEQFEAPLRANWPRHTNSPDPERSLQIGFVSADFCNHPVASFIEPVLAQLSIDPQLSLHAYYNYAVEDAVTERLRGYLAHWHPVVGLSDEVLAQRIRADSIDILIDLSGHTARNRLLTFARKPAPVQASWMGYPGTTGLRAMDYYLADRFFLPLVPFASQFTEQIVHLPASAPFMPAKAAPAVNALPALGKGHVTFGSFNRSDKLGRSVIALWGQLLRALPDSRMLLGGMPEQGKYDTLIEWFAQEGIARERLSFFARCGMDVYLGLHHQVDICLDTFPYNGGTTTYHALWMGVPTLTLAGSTAAGRTGAAILNQVGLEAFVAHDAADFVQKGVSWAGTLGALSAIRAGLRERFANSGMGRPALVAEALQRALRVMWRHWCAGLPPQSFEVSLQEIGNAMRAADK